MTKQKRRFNGSIANHNYKPSDKNIGNARYLPYFVYGSAKGIKYKKKWNLQDYIMSQSSEVITERI